MKSSARCAKNESHTLCKRWGRSWSRYIGGQPTSDLVINPEVGCHYFPPGPRLPSQLKSTTVPWPVLLGDRGTQVQVACLRPLRSAVQTGLEPLSCRYHWRCDGLTVKLQYVSYYHHNCKKYHNIQRKHSQLASTPNTLAILCCIHVNQRRDGPNTRWAYHIFVYRMSCKNATYTQRNAMRIQGSGVSLYAPSRWQKYTIKLLQLIEHYSCFRFLKFLFDNYIPFLG